MIKKDCLADEVLLSFLQMSDTHVLYFDKIVLQWIHYYMK